MPRKLGAIAKQAKDSLRLQANAIAQLSLRIDETFETAVQALHNTKGHVIITGLGKSGLVGRKIAATMASTGTPSFFVHSVEALHGDLGMVTPDDAVVLISYSGETAEVVQLIPHLRMRGVTTVALVGKLASTLATEADHVLEVSVDREICRNNLAPTSSSVTTLALGNTLAISLSHLRQFEEDDFARLHPGGRLGRKLSKVGDLMERKGWATLEPRTSVGTALVEMASNSAPLALVVQRGVLVGTLASADLSRALEQGPGAMDLSIRDFMREPPVVTNEETLVMHAECMMEEAGQDAIAVVDEDHHVRGMLIR